MTKQNASVWKSSPFTDGSPAATFALRLDPGEMYILIDHSQRIQDVVKASDFDKKNGTEEHQCQPNIVKTQERKVRFLTWDAQMVPGIQLDQAHVNI